MDYRFYEIIDSMAVMLSQMNEKLDYVVSEVKKAQDKKPIEGGEVKK